jgi:hypothetical protein
MVSSETLVVLRLPKARQMNFIFDAFSSESSVVPSRSPGTFLNNDIELTDGICSPLMMSWLQAIAEVCRIRYRPSVQHASVGMMSKSSRSGKSPFIQQNADSSKGTPEPN